MTKYKKVANAYAHMYKMKLKCIDCKCKYEHFSRHKTSDRKRCDDCIIKRNYKKIKKDCTK